jgi:precorrin-3B synthase
MSLVDTVGRGVPMQRCSASLEVSRPFTATVKAGATVLERATDLAADIATDRTKPGRAFACPGLFRIVPARDGGICRIKLARGRLRSTQARAIASAAEQFATGAIEATNRANIQIRGIHAGKESQVIAALLAAGLGAPNAGADDIRNVMVSPLAGDDTSQNADVSGLADSLLDRLQTEPRYHALSPKFSIQIDGGESLARLDHPNDIWLSAVAGLDTPAYAVGFAGCPSQGDRDQVAGFVAAEHARDFVLAAIDYFLPFSGTLNAAGQEISRFRHLLADHPRWR